MQQLRDYQQEDVQRCLTSKTLGIFSEQRTGKTPIICTVIEQSDMKRCLIVCPASLVYVWRDEILRWTDLVPYIIIDTKFKKTDVPTNAQVLIVNFEKLRGTAKQTPVLKELLKCKLEGCIIDEAHRMQSRGSLTTLALNKFMNLPYKFALTGTPATNHPWDVWSILHWLYPRMYSSFWRFAEEYFSMQRSFAGGEVHSKPYDFKSKRHETLLAMNLSAVSIQRKRAEVMPWASDLDKPTLVRLPLSKRQKKAIEQLETYFEYKHINTKNILELMIRVRQVCSCPKIVGLNYSSPKINWLLDYIKDYPEKSIIVFSHSTKFLTEIYNTLIKLLEVRLIVGETRKELRQGYVSQFQRKIFNILLIQIQTGKEGLTLDQADTTIFMDAYPPSADYLQAKDRMVATVPERVKPKEIIHVMMADTYDEVLFNLVEHNVEATAVVNDYKQYIERRKNHEQCSGTGISI